MTMIRPTFAPLSSAFIMTLLGAWLASSTVGADAPTSTHPALGAAGFLPTPANPLGWRGDGSGLYPGAHPPLSWSRRVAGSAVTHATYQARKPKSEAASPDAHPLELGIIKDWLVLGPFPADAPEQDIDKAFVGDEAKLSPDEGDKAGTLAWKPLHASIDTQSTHYTNEGTCDDYNVDFVFLYGQLKRQAAYAHSYIYSPTGGPAQLALRHFSAAAKIWLNGAPAIVDPKDPYGFHKAAVTLNRGWNRLLVKLSCDESTRAEGQNAWISKWRFAAYLTAVLPATYETTNIAWMAKLPGFSASSPVVVGERIFTTCGTSDLLCLSKKDGRILWLTTCTPCDAAGAPEQAAPGYQDKVVPLAAELRQANAALLTELNAAHALNGLAQDQQGKLDGMIRQKRELEKRLHDALRSIDGKKYPQLYINEVAGANGTPVTDGKRVYVVVGGGSKGPGAYVISAYTLDGERQWSYHEALGAAEHGNHASPAPVDGRLIYGVMDTLIAFDAASGKLAWRSQLPKSAPHYWDAMNESACTFVPARIMGTAVLVAAPGRIVRAVDGELLSKDNAETVFTGMSTPLVVNGMLFADGGKDLFAEQLPTSADGSLRAAWRIEAKSWRMEESSRFSIASALAVNGVYYTIDTMGALTAIDLASQKPLFMRRIELYQRANRQTFGFTASPTLGGKHIYFFDNTGCALLLEPGPAFKEAGKNIIENQVANEWWAYKQEYFYASPVFDDTAIYLKGSEYLYCLRQP